ncbi:MAG: ribonuclease HII [Bacillota bacterium]
MQESALHNLYNRMFPGLKTKLHEEKKRLHLMLSYERRCLRRGYSKVAGIDEAGRGPLAGPVIAAAAILPSGIKPYGLNDSKQMTKGQREYLYQHLLDSGAAIAWAGVDAEEIDVLNIYRATIKAMRLALEKLIPQPDFLLIDGMGIDLGMPGEAIVKGDAKSLSIAAASVVAKVARDRIMEEYASVYPEYGFDKHKGYPTPEHYRILQKLGPCKIHRLSFRLKEKA